MTIKVGTLCLLTGDHSRAGQCCTTTSPLHEVWGSNDAGQWVEGHGYDIALASGEPPTRARSWGALPRHLIPIAPPGLTERDDTREPIREAA